MKTFLQLFILFILGNSAFAQAVLWSQNSPGPQDYHYENHTLSTDNLGNVYSVGTFDGGIQYNLSGSFSGMIIKKEDSDGNLIWTKQIGPAAYSVTEANAITIDAAGNIYVSGKIGLYVGTTIDCDPGIGVFNLTVPTARNTNFILKLDANGNFVWVKPFLNPNAVIGSNNEIRALKVDASGNIYATGSFTGSPDFDPNAGVFNLTAVSTDIFILKLDALGSLVWVKTLTGASSTTNSGYSIDVDNSGNVYTVGYFTNSLDADPGAGISTLTAYTGFAGSVSQSGSNNIYVSKLDANGNFVWANFIGGDRSTNYLPNIAVDSVGSILISGYTFSDIGPAVSWADYDFGAGTYYLENNGGPFVLKVNSNGNFIWAKNTVLNTLHGYSDSFGIGFTLDSNDNIYTIGTFKGVCDFDSSSNTFSMTSIGTNVIAGSAGMPDIYISKIDTNGNFVWATKSGGTGTDEGYSITVANSGKVTFWGRSSSGFTKSAAAVSTGGFLASYSQPASLNNNQFENQKSRIKVYPNPVTDILTISNSELISKVEVIDMLGRTISSNIINDLETKLEVSNLSTGTYLVQVTIDNSFETFKIIKK